MNQELAGRLVLVKDEIDIPNLERGQVVDVTRAYTRRHSHEYRVILGNNPEEISFYYPVLLPEGAIATMSIPKLWVHPTEEGLLLVNPSAYEKRMRLTPEDKDYASMRQDLFNLGLIDGTGRKILIPVR